MRFERNGWGGSHMGTTAGSVGETFVPGGIVPTEVAGIDHATGVAPCDGTFRPVRGRRLLTILVALALASASCGAVRPGAGPPSPAPTANSGIEGQTVAAPTCPVVRPGVVCPPRPISAAVVVLDAAGREVTRFTSAGDGSFRVPLPPDAYTLAQPRTGSHTPPTLRPVAVTVAAGRYTSVVLEFDTGIR